MADMTSFEKALLLARNLPRSRFLFFAIVREKGDCRELYIEDTLVVRRGRK